MTQNLTPPSVPDKPSKNTLAFDDARAQLCRAARRAQKTESCPLEQALGRVLAHDIDSPINVPGFDNSAMDGYALHIEDVTSPQTTFEVVQRILAGHVGQALQVRQAARIFTGAPIPPGCNVVVPQEDVHAQGHRISLLKPIRLHQHIRRAGEDIARGDALIKASTRLAPQHLAMLASVGLAQVEVFEPIRVALIFTGDELVEPGNPLPPGTLYNSNRYAIESLLHKMGCVVQSVSIIKDDARLTEQALIHASHHSQVIITCGGVSVGEADHVRAAVQSLGHLDVWQIAMKPGKPLAFGRVGQADFIGLPGNPVSAFLTFVLLARPLLLKRLGRTDTDLTTYWVKSAFDWPSAKGRTEFLRVRCQHEPNGHIIAQRWPNQGAGVMSSLMWADGLVRVDPDTAIQKGDLVAYISLEHLLS